MKVTELRRTAVLPAPIADVFRFFESPENLSKITPAALNFNMLTPLPIKMREGALFDYIVQPFGFPMRWTTLITVYEAPHRFADVQIRGPYSYWHHTHTFKSADGGTEMEDRVLYALPFWPLGNLALPLVRRQLDAIFDFRQESIARHFGGPLNLLA